MSVDFDKERGTWRYDFQYKGERFAARVYRPDGSPVRTRREALDAEAAARAAAKAGRPPGREPAPQAVVDYAVADMMEAYRVASSRGRHAENQRRYGLELLRWFGPLRLVASIDEPMIDSYVAWAREQPVLIWHGGNRKPSSMTEEQAARLWKPAADGRTRDDATINRYLDALRKAMGLAAQARDATGRLLVPNPAKVKTLDEVEALPNPIPDDHLMRILSTAPGYLQDAARVAALMPFRKKELLSAHLTQIDDQNRAIRLSGHGAKGKRDELLIAEGTAWDIICRRRQEARKLGLPWLFWWTDKNGTHRQLKNPRRAWASACKRAGFAGRYRFHDLKATFSTAIAHEATDRVTQDLSRHKDSKTTARYVKIADKARRAAVQAISRRFADESPNPKSQPESGLMIGGGANPLIILVGAAGFEPTTPSPPGRGAGSKPLKSLIRKPANDAE